MTAEEPFELEARGAFWELERYIWGSGNGNLVTWMEEAESLDALLPERPELLSEEKLCW